MRDSLMSVDSSKMGNSASLKFTHTKLDSGVVNKCNQTLFIDSNLKVEAYIKQYPVNQQAELKRHIGWLRKKWQKVSNPFMATYMGNDVGDYHHILFKDSNGVEFDFGQASNT